MADKIRYVVLLLAASLFAESPFDLDSALARKAMLQAPQAIAKQQWQSGHLQSLRFETPRPWSSDQLWDLLDYSGGKDVWMEVDATGVLSPVLKNAIAGARQAWYRKAPGATTTLAILKGNAAASLEISAFTPQVEKPQPLECRFKGDLAVFQDFDAAGDDCDLDSPKGCLLRHPEDNRLEVLVHRKRIDMTLHMADKEPLPMVEKFRFLSVQEKREKVEDYLSYFKHEYALMVRSFIETTPGLFNWQIWHWQDWSGGGLISKPVIQSLLENGSQPSRIVIYQNKCKDGRTVELWSDGQGTMGMVVQ